MKNEEHCIQHSVIRAWSTLCCKYHLDENILFAIPNGGARNSITGAMLKMEGVRRGIPDLFLAVPNKNSSGLFIEMKTSKGVLSQYQKKMFDILEKQGYTCLVCRSGSEALDAIDKYLSNR